jgi:hypothetical protein
MDAMRAAGPARARGPWHGFGPLLMLLLFPGEAGAEPALQVPGPVLTLSEGDDQTLLHMDDLLDRMQELELERQHGIRDIWRGLAWVGLSLGLGTLGLVQGLDDEDSLLLAAPWLVCAIAGSALGLHLSWRGWGQTRASEAALDQLDRALGELTIDVGRGSTPPAGPSP